MQTTGPQDLDAIREWVKHHGTSEECAEIIAALPKLQQGEGFIYSPGWLQVLKRVKVRPRETFDSSRTPKPGEVRSKPKTLAEIDLTALTGKIAESIERAKESDPVELRKRIRKLEAEAKAAGTVDESGWKRKESDWKKREAGLISDLQRFKDSTVILGGALELIGKIATGDVVGNTKEVTKYIEGAAARLKGIAKPGSRPLVSTGSLSDSVELEDGRKRTENEVQTTDTRPRNGSLNPGNVTRRRVSTEHAEGIDGPGQKILDALAWWSSIGNDRPTRGQVGFVAGYSANGGSFKTYLSRLSSAGLIESGGGMVSLTGQGRSLADEDEFSRKTLAEYHRMILNVVKDGPLVKILEAVIQQQGRELHTNDVARLTGYESGGGSFKTYLSRVSSLGLIERRNGQIRPTDLLFPEGLS
jgi:hypothetical protein